MLDFIDTLEKAAGKKAIRNSLDMQKGDAPRPFASADLLERLTGYRPQTSVEEVTARVEWYREYRGKNGPLRV